jgi:hypothetical protein
MLSKLHFEYRRHTVPVCMDGFIRAVGDTAERFAASYSVMPPVGGGPSGQRFPKPSFALREDAELFAADSAKASVDDALRDPNAIEPLSYGPPC